jgi:hypothetical protein
MDSRLAAASNPNLGSSLRLMFRALLFISNLPIQAVFGGIPRVILPEINRAVN